MWISILNITEIETGKVYIEFENHSSGLFSVKGILTWLDNILAYKALA